MGEWWSLIILYWSLPAWYSDSAVEIGWRPRVKCLLSLILRM